MRTRFRVSARPTTVVRPCALVDIETSAPPRHRTWWLGHVACLQQIAGKGEPAHCRQATRLGRRMEKKPVHRDWPYCLELRGESRVGESISGLSLRIHCAMTAVSSERATRVQTHLDPTSESGCIGRARMNLRRRVLCRRALLLCPYTGLNRSALGFVRSGSGCRQHPSPDCSSRSYRRRCTSLRCSCRRSRAGTSLHRKFPCASTASSAQSR